MQGLWFDGRSSRAVPVLLQPDGAGGLCLTADDGSSTCWPLGEVSISPRLGSTPRVLSRPGHGQLEVADSPELDVWLPEPPSWIEHAADWLERRRTAIAAAALLTVLGLVGFVRYGMPALAGALAARMPAAVERHVSDQVVTLLDRLYFRPSTVPADRRAQLQRRFAALVRAEPRADQMRLRFVSAPAMGANAFALPDGRIFVTDELVALAGDDSQLLAVLAHEAGHHVHRHGMRQAIESSSVFLAAGLVFGDVSGSSLAVAIPATLLENGFSRGHEREADAYAFDLLARRGISPRAFAAIMRQLSRQVGGEAGGHAVAGYLSTHPPSPERIAAAEAAADAAGKRQAGP